MTQAAFHRPASFFLIRACVSVCVPLSRVENQSNRMDSECNLDPIRSVPFDLVAAAARIRKKRAKDTHCKSSCGVGARVPFERLRSPHARHNQSINRPVIDRIEIEAASNSLCRRIIDRIAGRGSLKVATTEIFVGQVDFGRSLVLACCCMLSRDPVLDRGATPSSMIRPWASAPFPPLSRLPVQGFRTATQALSTACRGRQGVWRRL